MKEKNKNFKRLVIFAIAATMCLSVLIIMPTSMAANAGENEINLLNSPPTPPSGRNSVDRDNIPKSVVILTAPTSEWTYGCTATSAGMLFGYYDRNGYANMYTGPTNGGVCPLTDLGQGVPGNLRYPITPSTYIIATENTLDGITQRAHVGDYWIGPSGTAGPDPWVTNVWTEHTWGKCTADYLGTNQWKWDFWLPHDCNIDGCKDGTTVYYTYTSGAKWFDPIPGTATCALQATCPCIGLGSSNPCGTACCHGCKLFAQSRGYSIATNGNYNQLTDTPMGTGTPGLGFTFANFKSEIDNGYPVLTHWKGYSSSHGWVGHTMLGVGYDDTNPSNPIIYFHDTWDNLLHWTPWTGTYSGYNLELRAVTVIHLAPCDEVPPTTTKTITGPKYGPNDEWVTSLTEFNLTAFDVGVGVNHTYYRIWYNGLWTPWMEYTGNFTLSGECKHYVEYFSTDYIGNVEEVHNQTHYVDDSPPIITLSFGIPYYDDGTSEWITSLTPITLDATDGGICPSGVKEIWYHYGAGWNFVAGNTVTFNIWLEGNHLIQYYGVDNLGNVEAVKSQTVKVDNHAPTTTKTYGLPYCTDGIDEWIKPETPITLDAVDTGPTQCGVKEIWYHYGAGWNFVAGNTATFNIWLEGNHLIQYYGVDNLGNVEAVKSQTVKVDNSNADAGGPYNMPEDTFTVHFDSSGSHVSACSLPAMYLWEFGDGQISTEQNPVYTYGRKGTYTVTLTITTACFSYTDITTVSISGEDPPIIQIIYPEDGDTINGVFTVRWFAVDDDYPQGIGIPIWLYYRPASAYVTDIRLIEDGLTNNIDMFTGEYDWDTSSLSDGDYVLIAETMDMNKNIVHDTVEITINNGNADVMVSDIHILDTSIGSDAFVKDGDTVEITAGITGPTTESTTATADLSGFGMGTNVETTDFDGFTATWTISNVVCTPSDGTITVTVTVNEIDSNSATITADNTAPEMVIEKPVNGLYFFNGRLLPLSRTIIIGPIDIELEGSSDIAKAEFFIDGVLLKTVTEEPFEWYMNIKAIGQHTLEVKVYDGAGNTATQSQGVTIYNLFGIEW